MNKIIIKISSILVLIAMLWQDILFAHPALAQEACPKATLQIPSRLQSVDRTACVETLVRAALAYRKTLEAVKKTDLRLEFEHEKGIVALNFHKRNDDDKVIVKGTYVDGEPYEAVVTLVGGVSPVDLPMKIKWLEAEKKSAESVAPQQPEKTSRKLRDWHKVYLDYVSEASKRWLETNPDKAGTKMLKLSLRLPFAVKSKIGHSDISVEMSDDRNVAKITLNGKVYESSIDKPLDLSSLKLSPAERFSMLVSLSDSEKPYFKWWPDGGGGIFDLFIEEEQKISSEASAEEEEIASIYLRIDSDMICIEQFTVNPGFRLTLLGTEFLRSAVDVIRKQSGLDIKRVRFNYLAEGAHGWLGYLEKIDFITCPLVDKEGTYWFLGKALGGKEYVHKVTSEKVSDISSKILKSMTPPSETQTRDKALECLTDAMEDVSDTFELNRFALYLPLVDRFCEYVISADTRDGLSHIQWEERIMSDNMPVKSRYDKLAGTLHQFTGEKWIFEQAARHNIGADLADFNPGSGTWKINDRRRLIDKMSKDVVLGAFVLKEDAEQVEEDIAKIDISVNQITYQAIYAPTLKEGGNNPKLLGMFWIMGDIDAIQLQAAKSFAIQAGYALERIYLLHSLGARMKQKTETDARLKELEQSVKMGKDFAVAYHDIKGRVRTATGFLKKLPLAAKSEVKKRMTIETDVNAMMDILHNAQLDIKKVQGQVVISKPAETALAFSNINLAAALIMAPDGERLRNVYGYYKAKSGAEQATAASLMQYAASSLSALNGLRGLTEDLDKIYSDTQKIFIGMHEELLAIMPLLQEYVDFPIDEARQCAEDTDAQIHEKARECDETLSRYEKDGGPEEEIRRLRTLLKSPDIKSLEKTRGYAKIFIEYVESGLPPMIDRLAQLIKTIGYIEETGVINLQNVIKEVIAEIRPELDVSGISIDISELSKEPIMVQAKPNAFKYYVIRELLQNAIKYMPKNNLTKNIKIWDLPVGDGSHVALYVKDTGRGVSKGFIIGQGNMDRLTPEEAAQITNRSGMGLHGALEMMRDIGGDLSIDMSRTELGQGSCFIVKCPLAAPKVSDVPEETGGLIGKYIPLEEVKFKFDETSGKGVAIFRAHNIDSPDPTQEEIVTIYGKRETEGRFLRFKRVDDEHHPEMKRINDKLEEFIKDFKGDRILIEPNKYGVNGRGGGSLLAIPEPIKDNNIAIFHELAHASGIDLAPYIEGGEEAINEYINREGKEYRKIPEMRAHYIARLFQRQRRGAEDERLTSKIKSLNEGVKTSAQLLEEWVKIEKDHNDNSDACNAAFKASIVNHILSNFRISGEKASMLQHLFLEPNQKEAEKLVLAEEFRGKYDEDGASADNIEAFAQGLSAEFLTTQIQYKDNSVIFGLMRKAIGNVRSIVNDCEMLLPKRKIKTQFIHLIRSPLLTFGGWLKSSIRIYNKIPPDQYLNKEELLRCLESMDDYLSRIGDKFIKFEKLPDEDVDITHIKKLLSEYRTELIKIVPLFKKAISIPKLIADEQDKTSSAYAHIAAINENLRRARGNLRYLRLRIGRLSVYLKTERSLYSLAKYFAKMIELAYISGSIKLHVDWIGNMKPQLIRQVGYKERPKCGETIKVSLSVFMREYFASAAAFKDEESRKRFVEENIEAYLGIWRKYNGSGNKWEHLWVPMKYEGQSGIDGHDWRMVADFVPDKPGKYNVKAFARSRTEDYAELKEGVWIRRKEDPIAMGFTCPGDISNTATNPFGDLQFDIEGPVQTAAVTSGSTYLGFNGGALMELWERHKRNKDKLSLSREDMDAIIAILPHALEQLESIHNNRELAMCVRGLVKYLDDGAETFRGTEYARQADEAMKAKAALLKYAEIIKRRNINPMLDTTKKILGFAVGMGALALIYYFRHEVMSFFSSLFEHLKTRLGLVFTLSTIASSALLVAIGKDETAFQDDSIKQQLDKLQLTDLDSYLFTGKGDHRTIYEKLGAHIVKVGDKTAGTYFAVWAPNAQEISVVGDFNNWNASANYMNRVGSTGVWQLFVPAAKKGAIYKYSVKGLDGVTRLKSDPYAFFNQFPTADQSGSNASIAWDLEYSWNDKQWMDARERSQALDKPISVYEVHLGSWQRKKDGSWLTYRELAEKLPDYIADLGFTHVELMPPMEHLFYGSWGYQVSNYYAPTSRYGTPQDFMYLVDQLHKKGIGVILDWVPAHFPKDESGLSAFDGSELYSHVDPREGEQLDWGTRTFNYGRTEVRNFLVANALFWLKKYHIDGLRVDAVASMLYRDYSRPEGKWKPNQYGGRENLEAIDFLKTFNTIVHGECPGILTIAEESTAYPGVSRPTYLGGLGFSIKWAMGWMNDTLKYFGLDPIYRSYIDNVKTSLLYILYAFSENFMLALSHDEVVHGKGSLLEKMPGGGDYWQKFANLRLLLGSMYTMPGKKHVFMGGEMGQHGEWNADGALDWSGLTKDVHRDKHLGMQRYIKDLNALYKREPALHESDFEHTGFEWIDFRDTSSSVVSFVRRTKDSGEEIVVVFNMTPVTRYNYRIGLSQEGVWHEVLNSDSKHYGGSDVGNMGEVTADKEPMHGKPCSVSLTLPPLGMLILKKEKKTIPQVEKPVASMDQEQLKPEAKDNEPRLDAAIRETDIREAEPLIPRALRPEQRVAGPEPYLQGMDDPKELVRNIIGVMATTGLKKKVAIACHKTIAGHENAKLRSLLSKIERLKEQEGFKLLFKNLVVIQSFTSGQDLDSQLKAQGMNPEDKDSNLIFTFAPESEKGTLSLETQGEIKSVFIDESKLDPAVYYYPLFEILLITLVKYLRQYDADTVKTKLQELNLKPEELNIEDITDDNMFVVFKLLPKATRYNVENVPERYVLIARAIDSAA